VVHFQLQVVLEEHRPVVLQPAYLVLFGGTTTKVLTLLFLGRCEVDVGFGRVRGVQITAC
jgi:hypothetical protein